jgi:predicted metal-dependent phosphoesterase TrpH
MHSTFSDGVYTPEELVSLAAELGHKAVILTDHDTIRGNYFMKRAARKAGLLCVSGIEFTTTAGHLVGLDFNTENVRMREFLARISPMQTERTHLMFDWGLERGTLREGITWQDVLDCFPDNDYFCNDQVFYAMMKHGVYKQEEYEIFHKPNFSYKLGLEDKIHEIIGIDLPDLEETVSVILAAGGVPVVAHPYKAQDKAEEYRRLGVMGFETNHPGMNKEERAFFDAFCTEHNLYKLGGTDHSSTLGGFAASEAGKARTPDSGGTSEENFMRLYRRELG